MSDDIEFDYQDPELDTDEIDHMSSTELAYFGEILSLEDYEALEREIMRRRKDLPELALRRLDSLRGDPSGIEALLLAYDRPIHESMTGLHLPF